MSLDGKTALVTGFAGAIGSTIAKTLANAGCDVIGIDRVKQKIAEKSIDEIKAGNRQDISYFECDLLKKEDVKKVSLEIKPTCKVDIIVNVAGWGRIINISSTCGLVARPSMSSYVASKTGLVGLTRAVALESAEFGVTCNAICPSTVNTPLVTKMIKDFQKTSTKSFDEMKVIYVTMILNFFKEEYLQCLPTKRFTEASQIADLVVFLCSPAGNNITGTSIPVDGGYTTS
uniref:3-oxoacyl-[acyl-carrier-protein] reductase n=1 Tax=Magallana gigas TaxID=29159 RepID=A0A8W8P0X0_MAGGI